MDERFLENLLRILPELESLSLAQWGDLTGQALNKLPPGTMRELNLNSCSNLRPNELLSVRFLTQNQTLFVKYKSGKS